MQNRATRTYIFIVLAIAVVIGVVFSIQLLRSTTAPAGDVSSPTYIRKENNMTHTDNNTQIPAPIQTFVDATNAGDSEAFIAVFTEDAYLEDWGRTFNGHAGAASWNQSDNIGKKAHFKIQSFRAGDQPDSYILTVKVSGDGYNGTGNIAFTLDGDHIARMVIS